MYLVLTSTMKEDLWLGLRYERSSAQWKWLNGESFEFTDWIVNEPNLDNDCAIVSLFLNFYTFIF